MNHRTQLISIPVNSSTRDTDFIYYLELYIAKKKETTNGVKQ